MPFVLDASATLAWILDDEDHPVAHLAFSRVPDDETLVPAVWWFEVRNALLIGEWKKRSTEARTAKALRLLARIPVTVDSAPEETTIFHFARQHHLTFYDAGYLELAARRNAPLATLDRALAKAARKENVALLESD
jgi:predicted nucleic acid-binding protein